MEKSFFVKCEPVWPSDTEETSNVELVVELSAVKVEDVKVELAPSFVRPGTEERTSVFVKEECLTQDVKKEPDCEYYGNDGQLPNQMQPLFHSTTINAPKAQSCDAHVEDIASGTHNMDTLCGTGSNIVDDGRVTWTCDYCSKSFRTQLLLREHVLLHGEDKLISSILNSVGNSVSYNESIYSCNVCCKPFAHRRLPERNGTSICVQCSSKSNKDPNRNSERMKTGRKKRLICCYCEKLFHFHSQLANHLRTHTGHKPFQCTICGRAFAFPSSLKRHEITHTLEKLHNCTYCEKRFSDKTSLKTHISTHIGERPYKCTACHKSFSAKRSFRRHVETHKDDKVFDCLTCGKTFAAKCYLNKHMVRHTGMKSFSCAYCSLAFAEKATLKNHLLTHTGEKPHSCAICGKCFSLISTLHRHQKIHSGQ